ncbi:MAG: hypothetical protein ACOCW2_04175 [Chitinivibrionales bacterium]
MQFLRMCLMGMFATVPLFADVLMDDFEDGLGNNPYLYWYAYTDADEEGNSEIVSHYNSATNALDELSSPGADSDSCALLHYRLGRLLANGNSYAALGGSLKDTSDLTGATAVRFDIKADTDMTVYFKVSTANITNHDYYAAPTSVTETFTTVELPLNTETFSQLWSDGGEFDLSVVRTFEWLVDAKYNEGFERSEGRLYVDNFTIVGDPVAFTSPPAAPVIIWPQTDDRAVSLNPTLEWSAPLSADSYNLQFSTTADFSSIIVQDDALKQNYLTVQALAEGTEFFWRVQAVNQFGESQWAGSHFTTNTSPPVPALSAPSDTIETLTPEFLWQATENTDIYKLELAADSQFADMLTVQTLSSPSYTHDALEDAETYYWRVYTINNAGLSPYSDIWSFTTPASLSTPIAASPINDTIENDTVALIWHSVTGATDYHLQLSDGDDFSTPIIDNDALSDTLLRTTDLPTGTFIWRVRALDGANRSYWSSVHSVTRQRAVPAAPEIVAAENDTLKKDSIVCRWYGNESASAYAFLLCRDAEMSDTVLFHDTVSDTSIILDELSDDQNYWWQVQARNETGWGDLSEKVKIIVDRPDVAVVPEAFSVRFTGAAIRNNTIAFALPDHAHVNMAVYDLKGRVVRRLITKRFTPGSHKIHIGSYAAGNYVLSFKAGKYSRLLPFTSK